MSVYAHTMQRNDAEKEAFYAKLRECTISTPKEDSFFAPGDLNERVGRDHSLWPGVLGKHGIGRMNANSCYCCNTALSSSSQ